MSHRDRRLITTLGPIPRGEVGVILPHEHVFVDLRRWHEAGYAQADATAVVGLMAPEIDRARSAGVTAIVEASTVGGRQVRMITHLDVDRTDVQRALDAVRAALA